MPIITQLNATKLRSLKYGNDTSDGGNSGQPYMKVSLKDVDKGFTKLRLTKFDDGLIRGGAIGALNASVVDTLRIGKFFTDFPKGPLFLAKQVGLQLSNPKLEAKKDASGFLSGVGPTRIYNLGINTIAQVPLNAFGGHLMRHGLLPVMNDNTKYLSVVTENNKDADNNRLVSLADKFDLGDGEVEVSVTLQDAVRTNRQNNRDGRQANREANRKGRKDNREANRQGRKNNRLVNQSTREGAKLEGFEFTRSKFNRSVFHCTAFKKTKINISDYTIDNYTGGPNSVYGIGRTIINRYSFTEDKIKIDSAFLNAKVETVRGSLSVNPLNEISGFADASGSYTTASLANQPISTYPLATLNPKEDEQFRALARKKSPKDFIYNVGNVPENRLQKDIGDGKIDINPHPLSWTFEKSFGTNHQPQVNPIVETPSDKFKVIKSALDYDLKKDQFKYIDENPTYIGGTREISIKQSNSGEEINTTSQDGNYSAATVTQQIKAKTQEEADAIAQAQMSNKTTTLNTVVVGRGDTRVKKTVKASVVDVSKKENNLEKIYTDGEMTSAPKTRVIQNGFITQKIDINRDPVDPTTQERTSHYFNGNKKVNRFDRVDSGIMVVEFDPINPFDATNLKHVKFSAYLSGFKYNSNSTWNPVKYVGRSESFYTFTEHKRDVSFNIQIPCFNRTHILEKHRALSELQSVGAGTYGNGNRLGGIITKVTLGSYLIEEPGILTSVSFDIPNESSWDVDIPNTDKQRVEKLAMYINAQFNFTILGNTLPTYQEGGFLSYLPNPIVGTGYLEGDLAR